MLYQSQQQTGSPSVWNIIHTPRGGQYLITLADGTKVWLNSASTLKFPASFDNNARAVKLSGEAYFEVSSNPSRPFIVESNGMRTEVLGTTFNVNSYPDENNIQTTLLQGSVRVVAGDQKKLLLPGQQGEWINGSGIHVKTTVDINDVIAWQRGLFKFRNADLPKIARQLSRWYDVEISTEGSMSNLKLGGGISRKLQLSEVLTLLKSNGAGHKWQNGRLILYPL